MDTLTQPPEDVEMKKIIDKLAQFVARNGAEFEQMTKQKQKDNPQFAFLFGGQYYNYYQYRVTTEQIIQKTQAQKAQNTEYMQSKMQQLQALEKELQQKTLSVAEQIKQSEANLQAHEKALSVQQQSEIDSSIVAKREKKIQEAAVQCSIDMGELEGVLSPLRTSCTKDNIQNAKSWVLVNIVDSATGEFFSSFLINRILTTDTTFEARLHLAYLINDIMHHCARKNAESLRRCMENVVIPVFCIASCQASEDQQPKLQKLLSIWTQHKYFISEIIESLEDPKDSLARYQADVITKYADVVTQVSQAAAERMKSLQAQHQEFATHLNDQLRKLQQQYENDKSSIMMSTTPQLASRAAPPPVNVAPNMNMPPPHFGPPPQDPNQMPSSLPGGPQAPPPNQQGGVFNPSQPPPMFNQPPPGFNANVPPPMPSHMSGPPPALPPQLSHPPPNIPPPVIASEDLIPTAPYYELPAGLMVPLVKMSDVDYTPINPSDIRLPPPAPPSDRLLQAVESFYQPPSHECPVDAEGWEKLGLFEFYQKKSEARKRLKEEKEAQIKEEKRFKETKREKATAKSRSRSRSRERDSRRSRRRRSRSSSRSPPSHRRRSRSPRRRRTRSRSPAPYKRRSTSRSRSRSRTPPRRSRIERRSPTPDELPVIGMTPTNMEMPLGLENKGAQLLKKMGWGGAGLGASEQGIVDPVKAAEVRGPSDLYRGIGSNTNDPFEAFRKNRSGTFIQKLKERDEKLQKMKKINEENMK